MFFRSIVRLPEGRQECEMFVWIENLTWLRLPSAPGTQPSPGGGSCPWCAVLRLRWNTVKGHGLSRLACHFPWSEINLSWVQWPTAATTAPPYQRKRLLPSAAGIWCDPFSQVATWCCTPSVARRQNTDAGGKTWICLSNRLQRIFNLFKVETLATFDADRKYQCHDNFQFNFFSTQIIQDRKWEWGDQLRNMKVIQIEWRSKIQPGFPTFYLMRWLESW